MRRSPLRTLLLLALCVGCDQGGTLTSDSGTGESTTGSSEATAAPRPMMIEFTRDYCLPCQVMAPWVAELKREHEGVVDVVEVNVDREANQRFALFFAVKTVPTQVFVNGTGQIQQRHEGVASKEELNKTFRRLGWVP